VGPICASARETVTKGTGGVTMRRARISTLTALASSACATWEAVGARSQAGFRHRKRDRPGSHSASTNFQHQARIVGLAIDILLRALQAALRSQGASRWISSASSERLRTGACHRASASYRPTPGKAASEGKRPRSKDRELPWATQVRSRIEQSGGVRPGTRTPAGSRHAAGSAGLRG